MKKFLGLILIFFVIGVIIMNYDKETEVAVISTKHGDMIVEFYPDIAPMHVESFVTLVNEQYFNGTSFHRVIP
ncbi:MAG: peptidyl-prolyl cis-trans isomerase, partial [Rickettsiales bacterium TMED289]